MNSEFVFYNNAYFRKEGNQLVPVTDPETLKGLKSNQLPHRVEPMGRSLTFADQQVKGTQEVAKPSPYAVAGGGTEKPASTSLPGRGMDTKALFDKALQDALKHFAGSSNIEELRARKDSLIARQLTAPTSAPGMEVRPEFETQMISKRGAEFGSALDILDNEIAKAKQGDAETLSKLNNLFSIGEKIGLFGKDEKKDTSVQEIAGRKVLIDNQTGDVIRDLGAAKEAGGIGGQSPYAAERAGRNLRSVDELMGKVTPWTVGKGSLLDILPETDARDFKASLDTLKANIAFGELTAMREASKTGGALGAVSNRELDLLQSALGALDTGQSPKAFKEGLQKVKDSINRWNSAVSGQTSTQQPTQTPQTKIIKGVTYVKTAGGWKRQ